MLADIDLRDSARVLREQGSGTLRWPVPSRDFLMPYQQRYVTHSLQVFVAMALKWTRILCSVIKREDIDVKCKSHRPDTR